MSSANRKLPDDEALGKLFDKGLNNVEIAEIYGVSSTAVRVSRLRVRPYEIKSRPIDEPRSIRTFPKADSSKVIREVEVSSGMGFTTLFISLPRIPTIHGHYTGERT